MLHRGLGAVFTHAIVRIPFCPFQMIEAGFNENAPLSAKVIDPTIEDMETWGMFAHAAYAVKFTIECGCDSPCQLLCENISIDEIASLPLLSNVVRNSTAQFCHHWSTKNPVAFSDCVELKGESFSSLSQGRLLLGNSSGTPVEQPFFEEASLPYILTSIPTEFRAVSAKFQRVR
jgi:hypothetical protein